MEKIREGDKSHERLLTLGNEQRVAEGEMGKGWSNWVMHTEEGT